MKPTDNEIQKQNAIYFWVVIFTILLLTTIILIGAFFYHRNQLKISNKKIELLESEIICQDINERKLETDCQIIEYLEDSLKECTSLKIDYYKYLETLKLKQYDK